MYSLSLSHPYQGCRLRFVLSILLVILSMAAPERARALVTVNPPLDITHKVQIQPIRTKKSNGGPVATFIGNSSTEAYIKAQIAAIWAQSGIEIEWLPLLDYESDFAYDGSPNNYSSSTRPGSDLGTILNGAPTPPKSADATVLNMYFVEIVPAFPQVSENTANGYARVDRNGCAVHVGSNLLNWQAGRDVVASVIAHEIGHNLGLYHTGNQLPNLMSPGGSTDQLDSSQTATVFTNNSGVDGYDFLFEAVTESNYTQWANASGVTGGPEGDHDGDRIANIIEFMLGLDGTSFSNLPPMIPGEDGLTWTLPKNNSALSDGLVYQVEVTNDLNNWYPAGSPSVPNTIVTDNDSALTVRLHPSQDLCMMRFTVDTPDSLEAVVRTFIPLEAAEFLNADVPEVYSGCGHGSCGCKTLVQE